MGIGPPLCNSALSNGGNVRHVGQRKIERLSRLVVATGGNQWQIGCGAEAAETSANRLDAGRTEDEDARASRTASSRSAVVSIPASPRTMIAPLVPSAAQGRSRPTASTSPTQSTSRAASSARSSSSYGAMDAGRATRGVRPTSGDRPAAALGRPARGRSQLAMSCLVGSRSTCVRSSRRRRRPGQAGVASKRARLPSAGAACQAPCHANEGGVDVREVQG